ncbi:hypothetical protein I204_07504 [Kwoniella mangroviensis CBS 8886]|nr:hypothetical protein I204_07504 [Kwoniella mangroviensis CBS 8886]
MLMPKTVFMRKEMMLLRGNRPAPDRMNMPTITLTKPPIIIIKTPTDLTKGLTITRPDTPHAQAQEHQHEAGPSPAIAYMLRDEVVQGVREGRARIALAEVFGCVSETPHDVAFRELINQLSSDEVAEMFRWLYYDLLERLGNEH